jgi:hypothetical protein
MNKPCTQPREDCGRPTEEDSEEDENNLFEEEDDLDEARVSPTLEEVIRHIDDPLSPGNRYTEITRGGSLNFCARVEARPSI